MVQVYLLLTLASSPLPLSLLHYYLTMCCMCFSCLKTSSRFLPFVLVTLLISYFLILSFRCNPITGRSPSPFHFTLWFCPLRFGTRFLLSPCGKFLSVLSISFLEEHLCSFSCNSCNINKSHRLPFAKSSITSSSPS